MKSSVFGFGTVYLVSGLSDRKASKVLPSSSIVTFAILPSSTASKKYEYDSSLLGLFIL